MSDLITPERLREFAFRIAVQPAGNHDPQDWAEMTDMFERAFRAAADKIDRLAADNAALRAEIDALKPEERVGECFCVPGDATPLVWLPAGMSFRISDPCWYHTELDDYYLPDQFCPNCGAQLCSDGIARRNADTARVQRVREALDEFDYDPHIGMGIHEKAFATQLRDVIRAALGPEVPE